MTIAILYSDVATRKFTNDSNRNYYLPFSRMVYPMPSNVNVYQRNEHQQECFFHLELTNIEKQLLTNSLRNDTDVIDSDRTSSSRLPWRRHIRSVFIDWRLYLYGLLGFGHGCVTFTLTTLLPRVMESMGYWKGAASLMITSTYVAACICCFLVSY